MTSKGLLLPLSPKRNECSAPPAKLTRGGAPAHLSVSAEFAPGCAERQSAENRKNLRGYARECGGAQGPQRGSARKILPPRNAAPTRRVRCGGAAAGYCFSAPPDFESP